MILVSYNLAIKKRIEQLYNIADMIRFNSAWFTPDELNAALILNSDKPRFVDIHENRKKNQVHKFIYEELLKICGDLSIEWVGISNVTSAETVLYAKEVLNNPYVKICSKIESEESVKNISEIITVSDGIMIDTEDLATDVGWDQCKQYVIEVKEFAREKCVIFDYSGVIFTVNVPELNNNVVYTYGAFDLLHPGHINLLKTAKTHGNRLIVGVVGDEAIKKLKGENRPVQNLNIRMEIVKNIKCVDSVIVQEDYDPVPNLEIVRPKYLVKGDDWDYIPGQEWIEKHGGILVKPKYTEGYSTSKTVKKIQG